MNRSPSSSAHHHQRPHRSTAAATDLAGNSTHRSFDDDYADNSLLPELDPAFQHPLSSLNSAAYIQDPHTTRRHSRSASPDEQQQTSRVKASETRPRSSYLPPTFSSDEDDDEAEDEAVSEEQQEETTSKTTGIKIIVRRNKDGAKMVSTRGAATHVSYAEEEVPPPETNGSRRRSARGNNAHYVEQDSDVSSDRDVGPSSRAGGSAGQQQQHSVRIRRPSSKALSNTTPKKEQSTTRMNGNAGQGRRLRSLASAAPGSRPVTPAGSPSRPRQGQSAHEDISTPPLRRNGEIAGYSTRSRGAPSGSEAASGEPSNQRSGGLANRALASGEAAKKDSELNQSSELSDGSMDPLGREIPANDARAPSEDDASGEDDEDEEELPMRTSKRGRAIVVKSYVEPGDDSGSEDEAPRARSRRDNRSSKLMSDFVEPDGYDEEEPDQAYGSSSRPKRSFNRGGNKLSDLARRKKSQRSSGSRRKDSFVVDDEGEDLDEETTGEDTDDHGGGRGPNYSLRQRKKVDYSLAAPPASPPRDGFGRVVSRGRNKGRSGANGGAFELDGNRASDLGLPHMGRKGKTGWDALPMSMTGKDYAKAFAEEGDSSDDDIPASRKAPQPPMFGGSAAGLLGAGPAALGGAADGNEGSARDSLGRIKKGGDALADIDPLGVNMQVDFDSVGGLDGHIQQLKEMVSLPLLYPEVFQRFKVTPPRGVLFHGPPGTGKTLVARALAASCSTSGQQISFFMRKGADCLSKWVGEAERQLRMLFDEARASQPSIIFFDEIDGLAPVRSSKQDQIHASIVSTLLALMDGMDGRGQVVVIGATNRPDSVDPALRRPGRFDREFYFPLPSREARRSIINIHTKQWEPPLSEDFKDKLSEVTKGYGGADLRALCTEAALNAVQRRYPQIYQTSERLLLQPETITVEAKDFMMSVNKLVPSSARSASSAAAPLPEFLKPVLGATVEQAIAALAKVMPPASKRNPLEEALWEDEPVASTSAAGALASVSDGGFGREMMLQSFESLRIFRPRLVIYGEEGMGQSFIGGALLHHLEGYHVQSLDIGALMGDSARTPEAAIVQLFVEAKRHKPSVLFIPGLVHWSNSVSETVKSTTKALLDELAPSDPVLLLAIAEAPLSELSPDVAKWFGYLRDNKVQAARPAVEQRREFFDELTQHITKPPTEFPDALPRRKRVLEELPKAPPKPPRVPTAAELQQQAADDQRLLEHLKYRLGPVLGELRKKFKKFTRDVWDEYNLHSLTKEYEYRREPGKVVVTLRYNKGFRRRRESSADETLLRNGAGSTHALTASQQPSRGTSAQPPAIRTEDAEDATMTDARDTSMSRLDGPHPTSEPSQQHATTAEGSSSLWGAMSFDARAQTQSANGEQQPLANGHAAGSHPPSASQPEPSRANGTDEEDDDPLFDYRVMPIFTMNLERMQRRLYYNGYLTIQDFMDDLGKIVSNAEEAAEVDTERVVRAHQMRNLAVILLDQYLDAAFRAECESMARRQLAREAEKQKAEDEAKRAIEEAAAAPRRPSGERFSARVQGQAPEHRFPVDVSAIERSSKRSRSSSARNSGGVEQEGGERKKARSNLINEVDVMIEAEVSASGSVSVEASGGEQAQLQLRQDRGTPVINGDETAGTSTAAPLAPASSLNGIGAIGEPSSATVPFVPVEHPPFECPPQDLERLRRHLLDMTSRFNIDQLLQLRAACFDVVWRRRSEWDRSSMLEELYGLVDEVAEAVEAETRANELQ